MTLSQSHSHMHDREERRDRGVAFVDDGRTHGLCNRYDGGDDNDDGLDRWNKKGVSSVWL